MRLRIAIPSGHHIFADWPRPNRARARPQQTDRRQFLAVLLVPHLLLISASANIAKAENQNAPKQPKTKQSAADRVKATYVIDHEVIVINSVSQTKTKK